MSSKDAANPEPRRESTPGGYGSPTPEDEMPGEAATDPGSLEPTLGGQEREGQSLDGDVNLGASDDGTPQEAPATDASGDA